MIGKLNYLEKSTQPDILFVFHQLAKYFTAQKAFHGVTFKHLGRYLLGMRNNCIILRTTTPMEFTCYVDVDFCGTWGKKHSENDYDTSHLQSGIFVFVSGAPVSGN
jgi:hypothetical protein